MLQRILKTELLVLFILTITSFYYFYFYSTIPDNIYSVSSTHGASVSLISYYFYSAISVVGFFVGPWVFFPFLFFALFYSFVFSRRSFVFDSIIFLCAAIFFLGIFSFSSPDFVGDGLLLVIKKYIGVTNLFIVSLLLFMLTLFLTFRMGFVEVVKKILFFIAKIPHSLYVSYQKIKEVTSSLYGFGQNVLGTTKSVTNKVQNLKLSKKESKQQSVGRQEFVRIKDDRSDLSEQSCKNLDGEQRELSGEPSVTNKRGEQTELNINEEQSLATPVSEGKVRDLSETKIPERKVKPIKNVNYKEFVDGALTSGIKSKITKDPDQRYFTEIINSIEDKLKEFKIDGKIVNILKGPVVDTFELELGAGVKVAKVTNLTDDLSLALAGAPIRMEYAAVGRTTIGIEVPREPRDYIYLDEVLTSDEYKNNHKRKLPLAMGQNVVGDSYVIDLASAPHMLVAGETGSGKSVFVHSLLVSLLMQKSPQSLRLLMIDPKQIEMMPYSKLPHLLMPVIINDKEASLALMWACQEMDKRYSILREFGVRNLEGFNEKLKDATPSMLANIHQYYEDDSNYELPYIVVVVDEYADLILGPAGKEIENSICRLGQKARAAGIHVILTTQRPSANVVTGLIKANFPTRVSLKVASAMDSRVILDKNGAEKLLGNGDMLYKKGTELIRIHSSFVSVEEVESLVTKLSNLEVNYDTGAMEFLENGGNDSDFAGDTSSGGGNISEDLFNQAVEFVLTQKMASTSSLQRKFRIGYNKAADLADLLERRGVVGPSQGSKGREVIGPPV